MKAIRLILITLTAVLAFGLYKAYQAAMGEREWVGVAGINENEVGNVYQPRCLCGKTRG